MFLQYFRPQLYSGDTACRIWGHPWLPSGTRPSAFGDTPGFIPGHGLPHLGTPLASFRDTAFRTLGHPGFIPGHTHCNPEPHPGVQLDPAGNAIRYCRKYRGSLQKIPRQSACRQLVPPPPSQILLRPQTNFRCILNHTLTLPAYYRTVNKPNLEDLT